MNSFLYFTFYWLLEITLGLEKALYCIFSIFRKNFIFANIHKFDTSRIQPSHKISAWQLYGIYMHPEFISTNKVSIKNCETKSMRK